MRSCERAAHYPHERKIVMYRIGKEEKEAVARVIDSGELFKVNNGPLQETANFEKELREKFGINHALLMTSGKAALTSALIGMGIGPGDEVIVPAYTYMATAVAVLATGAIPVVAEIDETLMLDPKDIENKITKNTKAIIPVHMMGYPCDMDAIMAVAKKHNLFVLEDSCQADGGSYKGKRLGTIGDAGALSFNYFKIISAGEGGALLTNNEEIFEKGLIFHDSSAVAYFGDQMSGFTVEPFCGHEFRTNEITAAIMREQLKRLDGILADLRSVKKSLKDKLSAHFEIIPSNDYEGDCGTTLTLMFKTTEEAQAFVEKAYDVAIPGFMGKHMYYGWTPILNKRGAAHPRMNPYNMAENANAPEMTENCCPRSKDLLTRSVHIFLQADWTEEEIAKRANDYIAALN